MHIESAAVNIVELEKQTAVAVAVASSVPVVLSALDLRPASETRCIAWSNEVEHP
jgi:hypothetical protein